MQRVVAGPTQQSPQFESPTFDHYVAARGAALWRAAWLLTGDRGLAEDLVQTALARAWPHYSRVAAAGSFDAYVRRTIVTTYVSWRGRRWHGEMPTAAEVMPEPAGESRDVGTTVDVSRALASLSPRQRAVVVLRYYEDLTEAETARALGTSQASVKTHHRRALAALRVGGLLSHDSETVPGQEPS